MVVFLTEDRLYKKSGTEWVTWSIALNAGRRTRKSGQLYYRRSLVQQLKPEDNLIEVGNNMRKLSTGKIAITQTQTNIHEQSKREEWK